MAEPLPWVYDDGGRAAAGRRGHADDCAVRAIAIATGKPYGEVYELVNKYGRAERTRKSRRTGQPRPKSSARTGVYGPTFSRIMRDLGWQWYPTMGIGTGTQVHLAVGELPTLPETRLIAQVSRHWCAIVNGVIHDTHDPSREGTRAVYGYWYQPTDFD